MRESGDGVNTITPSCINDAVLKLVERLPKPGTPVYLDLQIEPDSHPLECFANVRAKIVRDGGSLQHGWVIWEWPGVLVEAEFHAVWNGGDGRFVDITPQVGGQTRVLFVPDSETVFDGVPIDNVRLPLSDDPQVLQLIQDSEKLAKLKAKYFHNGVAAIPCEELVAAGLAPRTRSAKGIGRNEPCPCGSGKKYKKCCLNAQAASIRLH